MAILGFCTNKQQPLNRPWQQQVASPCGRFPWSSSNTSQITCPQALCYLCSWRERVIPNAVQTGAMLMLNVCSVATTCACRSATCDRHIFFVQYPSAPGHMAMTRRSEPVVKDASLMDIPSALVDHRRSAKLTSLDQATSEDLGSVYQQPSAYVLTSGEHRWYHYTTMHSSPSCLPKLLPSNAGVRLCACMGPRKEAT
jgi:hypothetical protein